MYISRTGCQGQLSETSLIPVFLSLSILASGVAPLPSTPNGWNKTSDNPQSLQYSLATDVQVVEKALVYVTVIVLSPHLLKRKFREEVSFQYFPLLPPSFSA